MSTIIPEQELPTDLNHLASIEAAYPDELGDLESAIQRRLSVLIECNKNMNLFLYSVIRRRVRENFQLVVIDGRAVSDPSQQMMGPSSLVSSMISGITEAVRDSDDDEHGRPKIIVLPHLDLLTTSSGNMVTSEAKEAIALMHENPNVCYIGFKDPSFSLPATIKQVFQQSVQFMGIPRLRLSHLVTQQEARKLRSEKGLDSYRLYKQVSGINAVSLRDLMNSLHNLEDYPDNDSHVWRMIRKGTLEQDMELPNIKFDDIGGYDKVKTKIKRDILELLQRCDDVNSEESIEQIEKLIPRGLLYEGPPGTGKTMFAKALATELGAAVQVVNGPELKSRWVGESEENLRNIFNKARKNAPSIIVFDEIDSFAARRDLVSAGSGVEHSMVNQLLTEMDGFRDNELVFVVGTTNFVESLDPALLRPGRFEFHLTIPYPNDEDREAIFKIYNEKFNLKMTPKAIKDAVKTTSYPLPRGGKWSGDHIQALCRQLARDRIRSKKSDKTNSKDIEEAKRASQDIVELNDSEKKIVATHECGHAIVALQMKSLAPITRISIQGDISGALGFVEHGEHENKNIITHTQLFERIQVLFGGPLAEEIIIGEKSVGSSHDLEMANRIARSLIVNFGYQELSSVVAQSHKEISEETRKYVDDQITDLLKRAQDKARDIIIKNQKELLALRNDLLKKEVIEIKQ